MSARTALFLTIALGLGAIGWLLHRDGWLVTWERWGMVSRQPFFSDLRVLTGAIDTMEAGGDPAVANPGAPFGQLLNQPRVWLYLFYALGIHEKDSAAVGLVFECGLLLGLWWISRGIGWPAAAFFALIFFSPVTLLAVERCNADLAMFFLLALAFALSARSTIAATAVVLVAFMLKLFPLAGILFLLREIPRRALRLAAAALACAAIYLLANWSDLRVIWSTTEKGADVAYGYNVLWAYLSLEKSPLATPVHWLSLLLVAGGLAVAARQFLQPAPTPAPPPTRALDAYRIGAGVYAGTFLLGNSWDYRMIFFFFAVPQLFDWAARGHRLRPLAISQLAAFFAATWSMLFYRWFSHGPLSFAFVRGTEELAKWWLFLSSLYLLAHTLPAWIRPSAFFSRPSVAAGAAGGAS